MENIRTGYLKQQEIELKATRTSTGFIDKLGNYLSDFFSFFTSGLVTVKNKMVDGSTDLFHGSVSDQYVQSLHYNFDKQLHSVAQSNLIELKNITSFSKKDDGKKRVNSREEFSSALEKIKTNIEPSAESSKKIQAVIDYLSKKNDANLELDVVENAYVSSRLEAALVDLASELAIKTKALKKANLLHQASIHPTHDYEGEDQRIKAEVASNKCRRLETAINLLKPLENQAFLGWNHLANEKKIDALEEHYRPQFKVGYSRSITLDGSIGISLGSPINVKGAALEAQASFNGAINVLWMLDDEGYIAIVKTVALGTSAEVNVDLLCAAKASASIKGNLTKGEYCEVRSSREFVTYLLPDLIRDSKHRDDPKVAPYLSRSATLAHAMANKGIAQSNELWAVTRKESNDIGRVKKEHDLVSNHNDMLHSLSMSSTSLNLKPTIQREKMSDAIVRLQALSWIEEYVDIQKICSIEKLNEELKNLSEPSSIEEAALRYIEDYKKIKETRIDKTKKTFTSKKIDVTTVKVGKANLSAYSAESAAGAEIGIGINGVQDVLTASASGSITRKHRVLEDFRSTSFGQLIADTYSEGDIRTIKDLINQKELSQEDISSIIELINRDTLSQTDMHSISSLIKEIEENSAKEKQEIIDLILKPKLALNAKDTRSDREKLSIQKEILASPMDSDEEKQKIISLIADDLMDSTEVSRLKEKISASTREPSDKEQKLIALLVKYLKLPEEVNRIKKLIPEHRMNLKVLMDKMMEPIIHDSMKKKERVIALLEKILVIPEEKQESENLSFKANSDKKNQRVSELLSLLMTNSPVKKEEFTKQLFEESIKKNTIKKGISNQFHFFKNTLLGNWKKETDQIALTQTGIDLQKMSFDNKVSDEQFLGYFEEEKLHQLTSADRWKIFVDYGLVKTSKTTDFADLNELRNNLLKLRKNDQTSTEHKKLLKEYGLVKESGTLTDIGSQLQKMFFNTKVSDEEFLAFFEKKILGEKLLELRKKIIKKKITGEKLLDPGKRVTEPSERSKRWELLNDFDLVKTSNTTDLSDGKVMYKFLKQDFKFYTDLHVRIALRGYTTPQDEESLAHFAERYGVKRDSTNVKEQVLHRMIIANADLLSKVKDKALKAEMLEFEQELLSPEFEIDLDYMKRNACFQQDIDFEIIENIATAEVKFAIVSGSCTFKFEAIQRERIHTNQLRDGNYWDLNFSTSGEITDINALISSITESVTQKYPPELAEQILADMTSVLNSVAVTGSVGREKAYLLRYFKPTAFGGNLPYKKLFNRVSIDKQFQIGIKGSISTGLPFNVTLGLGYSDLSTDSEVEYFSADTFIYAFMFGMHEYAITSDQKSSYDIATNSTWKLIKQQQEAYFKKAFQNYASELQAGKVEHDSLSEEINAIEEEIMNNQNLSQAQKNAFKKAKEDFQKAVKIPLHKQFHYEAALTSFEKLMHAYSPNWLDKRANSTHFKEGYLPKLESAGLSTRIQESKRQYAIVEEDKYKYESALFPGLMPANSGADLMGCYFG